MSRPEEYERLSDHNKKKLPATAGASFDRAQWGFMGSELIQASPGLQNRPRRSAICRSGNGSSRMPEIDRFGRVPAPEDQFPNRKAGRIGQESRERRGHGFWNLLKASQ